jgi:hypothetical protein
VGNVKIKFLGRPKAAAVKFGVDEDRLWKAHIWFQRSASRLYHMVYQNGITACLLENIFTRLCDDMFLSGMALPLQTLSLKNTVMEHRIKKSQLKVIKKAAKTYLSPFLPKALGELVMEYLVSD